MDENAGAFPDRRLQRGRSSFGKDPGDYQALGRLCYIRNYFWREGGSQGIEHRQDVDDFLTNRTGYRAQVAGRGEHHPNQA